MTMENRLCEICQASFSPNKYSPRQKICSNPECQKKRQHESMRLWREKNPNYFKYDESKGAEWLATQRRRSKLWREKYPDKVKNYRQTHLSEYREYMRDYMRRYRERRKSLEGPQANPAQDGGPAAQTPQNP